MKETPLGFNISSKYYEKTKLFSSKTKVLVWVESDDDKRLWINAFKKFKDNYNFSFFCASEHEFDDGVFSDGCCRIFKLLKTGNIILGKHCIACLDSDFSFISDNYKAKGKEFLQTEYVYETYVHSKENLYFNKNGINDFISQLVGEDIEQHHINLSEIYDAISKSVHGVFLNLMILYRDGQVAGFEAIMSEFVAGIMSVTNVSRFEDFADGSFNVNLEKFVTDFSQSLKDKMNGYCDVDAVEDMSAHFSKIGVSESDAYLFIRGHNFHAIILNVLKKIEKYTFNLKISRYGKKNIPKEIAASKKKELAGKRVDIESAFLSREIDKDIPFFKKTLDLLQENYGR
ncbi:DUF4435 domain-containing protein [Klebsiella pneumoniae]|nr:DUF4435 domain-containing protein [Klebsiella pneumoniae]MCA5400615.1 DUF4435 domain-containing protein [Klebsiella pneumoniae]HBR5678826.1 DUF4435 domain-containing protein [Klebsiella pneumoniae]HDH1510541.1 DUF4435 domain-containing protein [Klebsiella quasipneumoniae subsp. similipneumoniae]HDU2687166.1 DUF4435 domain-containing protein [Klebsiella pneumoniae]